MKKECIVFATTFLLAVLTAFSVLGFDFSTLGIPVIPGNAPNGQAVTGVNSSGNLQYRNVAANLASPGPIGNASASTGNFTTLQSTVLMVNGGANFIGNAPQMFTVNGNAQINGAVNGFSFTANGNAVVTAANIIATSFTVTPSNVTITGAANSSYNLASFGANASPIGAQGSLTSYVLCNASMSFDFTQTARHYTCNAAMDGNYTFNLANAALNSSEDGQIYSFDLLQDGVGNRVPTIVSGQATIHWDLGDPAWTSGTASKYDIVQCRVAYGGGALNILFCSILNTL
jgi:hypothetical protein